MAGAPVTVIKCILIGDSGTFLFCLVDDGFIAIIPSFFLHTLHRFASWPRRP